MKLLIREIIIWPEDIRHDPRVISLDPDRISVVSGWSGTGKSSIAAIIDYVLGAGSSSIPVGLIRDEASWFGLTLDTEVGPMRLARAKPEAREVSDAYWLQQGEACATPLPTRPGRNARTDRIKQLFDDLSQLSNLSTDPEMRGYNARASFRDMAAFNFLPQHIVANPYTMFFKADTSEHREKLRNVLPLALGVVTNEDLVRAHTRKLLRDELRRAESDLKLRREALDRWRANATGAFLRAQELGLLPLGPLPDDLQQVIAMLQRVVGAAGAQAASPGRVSAAVKNLEELRKREQELDRAIADRRRRLRRLRSLRSSVTDYDAVLADQRDRVRGVGWLRDAIVADECVLCGNSSETARRALEELDQPIAELEELTAGTTSTAPMVDREIVEIERELLTSEQQLLDVRRTRAVAEEAAGREQGRTQSLESVYRFIGSTEQALLMLGEVEGEGGLLANVAELKAKLAELDRAFDASMRQSREREIGTRISRGVSRFIEVLGIEGAQGQPTLDYRELNLRFQREGANKSDFLWEIGSGENWMAYHLATMFSLHAVFLRRGVANPVPSFLVIDQPSQVYFPSDTYEEYLDADGQVAAGRRRDDLERTRQIFRAIAHVHAALEPKLQIIILDHADRNAWGDETSYVSVGNWRGSEDWLIPRHWYAQGSESSP
jgi:hypothetical protein